MATLDDNDFDFKQLRQKVVRKKILMRLLLLLSSMVLWTFLLVAFWILINLLLFSPTALSPILFWINYIFGIGYLISIAYAAYLFVCLLIELLQENNYIYTINIQRIENIGQGYAGKIYFEAPLHKKQFGQLEGKEWNQKQAAVYQCFSENKPIEVVIGKYSKQIWDISIPDQVLNF